MNQEHDYDIITLCLYESCKCLKPFCHVFTVGNDTRRDYCSVKYVFIWLALGLMHYPF